MNRCDVVSYGVLSTLAVAASVPPPFPGLALAKAVPTAALAVIAWRTTRAAYAGRVALAVALGSVGDYLLATFSRALFLPGLVAFLAGHLAYLAAFARPRRATRGRVAIAAGVVAYALGYTAYLVARDPVVDGVRVAGPVAAYVAVLVATAVAAIVHRAPTKLLAAGAVTFVVSDSHIPVNFLLLPAPDDTLVLTGYATYYLAQGLLVAGAGAASRAAALTEGAAAPLPP